MKKTFYIFIFISILSVSGAKAQSEGFLGEIRMTGFSFAPSGWALCDGSILPISQNQALFSILGTTYGGDGETTFALPDMRGRAAIGQGNGPGLTPRTLGSKLGTETNTLVLANLPEHTHEFSVKAVSETGNTNAPESNYLANTSLFDNEYRDAGTVVNMNAQTTSTTNGAQSTAVNNMQPTGTINYIICIQGLFPSPN